MVVLTTMLLASTMMLFMNSGGEIAFFSLGISDLKNMRQKRYPSAGKILKLLSDPSLLLSAMLAGNLFYRIMIILICNQLIVPASFPDWPVFLPSAEIRELPPADHLFSSRQVEYISNRSAVLDFFRRDIP